jgi:hypothetical protein
VRKEQEDFEETTLWGEDATGYAVSGVRYLEREEQAVYPMQKPRRTETGPRTPDGLERCRRANWKHGKYARS